MTPPRRHRMACIACLIAFSICGLATRLAAEDGGVVPANAQIALLRDPGTPSAGAFHPDVTLIEYFDYNCGYCKKLNPALISLLETDQRTALVYKDWPILGENSRYAAESALAAGWQGKYRAAHETLMNAPHLTSHAQIDSLLQSAGIDMAALQKDRAQHAQDIRALLQRNDTEAGALGIHGTPGLLVGRHFTYNAFDLPALRQAVALARQDR